MRASTSHYDYIRATSERLVHSWDRYLSYSLIVDKATRYIWVFLTKSKTPPLDILNGFFTRFGHAPPGSVHTNQGGKLACSFALSDLLLRNYHYVLEPTGVDSLSQNGAVEIYNNKLAIHTHTLLYGSGQPAKYWSSALQHPVYLHNRLVHAIAKKTPFKGMYNAKPDISHLKLFGSRMCLKISGICRGNLDKHNLKGIFLGYTATDHNIVYLDLNSGIVKCSHHAQFNKAWYLQESRSPATQLLYKIGLVPDMPTDNDPDKDVAQATPCAPWPPEVSHNALNTIGAVPEKCTQLPLSFGHTAYVMQKHSIAAKAAKTSLPCPNKSRLARRPKAMDIMADYEISKSNMVMIYLSPDPYFDAFEQPINIRHFDLTKHDTARLSLHESDGHLHLGTMSRSTPTAKMKDWQTRVKGMWLIKIGNTTVTTINKVKLAFKLMQESGSTSTILLCTHPEVRPNLTHDGLPIISSTPFSQATHDQLNNRWEFSTVAEHLKSCRTIPTTRESGSVRNVVTTIMKLTRSCHPQLGRMAGIRVPTTKPV
jgi:hypothetical protein